MSIPSVHAIDDAASSLPRPKLLTPVIASTVPTERAAVPCDGAAMEAARVEWVLMLRKVHKGRDYRSLADDYQTNRENVRRWHSIDFAARRPMPAAALLLTGDQEFEAIVTSLRAARARRSP